MKKLSLLSLLTLLSLTLHAEVLKVENFDYTIGSDLLQQGWLTTYGTATACGITVTNGLSFPGYAGSGVGGAALLDTESNSEQPHLAFAQQNSGDIYVAFLFQPTINQKKSYFFCLRDAVSTTAFNFNARIFLGEDNRLGFTFADSKKTVFDGNPLQSNTVYLLVVKYHIVPGSNNDEASLFVFPSTALVPTTEPETPFLKATDSQKADINPSHVVLRSYDTNGWLVVDGIRVATTWEEAVAMQPTALQQIYQQTTCRKVLRNGQLQLITPQGYFTVGGIQVK